MKDLLREMFFGFVAIAMLTELVGADLFCLTFALDRVEEMLSIDERLAFRHMMSLALWNAVASLGAGMVFFSLRKHRRSRLRRIGMALTLTGLFSYGIYQFWFATTYLGEISVFVKSAAVVYVLFGLVAWLLGREVLLESWQPEQPVQRLPHETFRTNPS